MIYGLSCAIRINKFNRAMLGPCEILITISTIVLAFYSRNGTKFY